MVTRLGVAAALVDGELVAGDVAIDDGMVTDIGLGAAGTGTAVAGFVDLQVNGYGGVDFTSGDLAGHRHAREQLARSGVTSFLVTIPTAPLERYADALATASASIEEGASTAGARPLGVHLEGPFLSPARAGAHPPSCLRPPDRALVDRFLAAAPICLVTLAPELPGALDVIAHLADHHVVVALGHSDATGAEAHAGFDAGATAVTHLWNAQRPPTAREPGLTLTALARDDISICLIADLVHVGAETVAVTARAAGRRLVVVTDAVAPAGVAPASAGARLADGTLAGSTGPMDASLRNLVDVGIPLERAVDAMTAAPAALLGRADVGRLRPGGRADVVVLDDDLTIRDVLVGGRLT